MKLAYQAFLLSSLLLAGCTAVGPDYSAPCCPLRNGHKLRRPIAVLVRAMSRCRGGVFDEPALSQLIQQALAANHDIGIAAARLDEAKAMLRGAARASCPAAVPRWGMSTDSASEVETPLGQQRSLETRARAGCRLGNRLVRPRPSLGEAAQAQAGSRQALAAQRAGERRRHVRQPGSSCRGRSRAGGGGGHQSKPARQPGPGGTLGQCRRRHRIRSAACRGLLRNVDAVAPGLERRRPPPPTRWRYYWGRLHKV